MSWWLTAALIFLWTSCGLAEGRVVKRTLREEPAPELISVPNANLEQVIRGDFAGWARYGLGYQVDGEVKHSGRFSARCGNLSPQEQRGLVLAVELNQKRPAPVTAECWSKADQVSPGRSEDYSLYLDLEYADGTPLWGQLAPFQAGSHGWQCGRVTVLPAKPIKRISMYALLRHRTGTAWFDDFRLWERRAPGGISLFDLVPVIASYSSEVKSVPRPALKTDDGFVLQLDSDGDVITTGRGGFRLRDVAAKSDIVRPRGSVSRQPDGSLRFAGEDEELKLRLAVTYRSVGRAIRVDGELEDLTGRDRAITVYFTYPVDAIGWQWHDDQRSSRRIEAGEKYDNFVDRGAGANGLASRYPLACIGGPGEALAVGAPLDLPRLWRFGYDAESRELYAAVDLGLSRDTKKSPSRASFSLVLYRSDPAWGFRAALERYYQLFPDAFTKRNRKEGIWMPFTDIESVEGFQDFGFQFKEGTTTCPSMWRTASTASSTSSPGAAGSTCRRKWSAPFPPPWP